MRREERGREEAREALRMPVAREVDEETAFHLEMRVREYVAAGMSEAEAWRVAEARFGDLGRVKSEMRRLGEERERQMARAKWREDVVQDVRLAARQVRRQPGFATVAVLTLALAIGANTTVFSVVNGVLLRPLPYEDPEELVALWTRYLPSSGLDIPQFPLSGPELIDYREASSALDDVVPYMPAFGALSGDADQPERLRVTAVGRGLFELLGARPALGRTFDGTEHEAGADRVILLSHGLWMRRFGGDPRVIGSTVELDGRSNSVAGVMPEDFAFPDASCELWIPLVLDEEDPGNRGSHGLYAVGRLAPGATLEQAEAEGEIITARWNGEYEHHAMGHFVFLRSLSDDVVGDVRPILVLLMVAVGLVLLIACGNVANLFIARGEARQREMAVRTALGAGRSRLVRQLLAEGMVISIAGAAAGLALAWAAVPLVLRIDPTALPRAEAVGMDGAVVAFTLAAAALTTLVFGLVPAMTRHADASEALREGRVVGGGSAHARRLLVAGQVALGLVVVLAAGLVVRSLVALHAVDPGVRTESVATFGLSLPSSAYEEPERVVTFYESLVDRLRAIPGVQDAGAVSTLPLTGVAGRSDFLPEGEPAPPDGVPAWNAQLVAALPSYFATLDVPLLAGRLPGVTDDASAVPVAVMNEAAVRRYFPDGPPLGRRITFRGDPSWITVVGIVGDARHALGEEAEPTVFIPHAQLAAGDLGTGRGMSIVVRTDADPATLLPAMRRAVAELDPRLPLSNPRTMEDVAAVSIARPRLTATLLGGFALLGLVLACVGVYGVVSYTVARRTREIGVRVALGARRDQVMRMLVAQGIRPAAVGVAVGLFAALVLAHLVESLLFGIGAHDPLTFAGAAAALVGVALLATWIPARHASGIPATEALREE